MASSHGSWTYRQTGLILRGIWKDRAWEIISDRIYIIENPVRWGEDENNPLNMTKDNKRAYCSRRISPASWKDSARSPDLNRGNRKHYDACYSQRTKNQGRNSSENSTDIASHVYFTSSSGSPREGCHAFLMEPSYWISSKTNANHQAHIPAATFRYICGSYSLMMHNYTAWEIASIGEIPTWPKPSFLPWGGSWFLLFYSILRFACFCTFTLLHFFTLLFCLLRYAEFNMLASFRFLIFLYLSLRLYLLLRLFQMSGKGINIQGFWGERGEFAGASVCSWRGGKF